MLTVCFGSIPHSLRAGGVGDPGSIPFLQPALDLFHYITTYEVQFQPCITRGIPDQYRVYFKKVLERQSTL
jgi:hypothetical protein